MYSLYSKKEKCLSVIAVIVLFTIVGSILFLISLDNKRKTEALQVKVMQLQKARELQEKLDLISLDNLPVTGLTSKSFLTLAVTKNGVEKIINQKEPNLVLPIASITKLMVALISVENSDLQKTITASRNYIGLEQSAFVLKTSHVYKVGELLANALIPSDNDSARLLSSLLGEEAFLAKMNAKARDLGMTNTKYVNVTGLDPKEPGAGMNVSTVTDLAKLAVYIKNNYPEIFKIGSHDEYNFCDVNNDCKIIQSTNKLLIDPSFRFKIIGGKTGSTELAGKNLLLVTSLADDIDLVNIVLGSEDNFNDTTTLINHIITTN